MSDIHFNQERQRSAELIQPDPSLKLKVGHGGLDKTIIEKAQKLINDNTYDFLPMGMRYLTALQEASKIAKTQHKKHDLNSIIAIITSPAMQLKANGSMFGYPLVTKISDLMIRYLEAITELDQDAFDVLNGFVTSLNAVFVGNIRDSDPTGAGDELYTALYDACDRYFQKT